MLERDVLFKKHEFHVEFENITIGQSSMSSFYKSEYFFHGKSALIIFDENLNCNDP